MNAVLNGISHLLLGIVTENQATWLEKEMVAVAHDSNVQETDGQSGKVGHVRGLNQDKWT